LNRKKTAAIYRLASLSFRSNYKLIETSVVKVVFVKRGGSPAHPTKPGWSKPHTHSNPTNFALFRHKITLYRFNQVGLILLQGGGLKWEQAAELPWPPSL